MADQPDAAFDGSIPDMYDQYLVPLIFEQYAADLASRAARLQPASVLEVAAGSGVVTRAVAAILDETAEFTASDLNPPMLQRAASQQSDPDRIRWQPADALDLPFPDDAFDLVLCQFGAMFFPDRVKAYQQARRVLAPGGLFIFNMWDRIEENEFADAVTTAMAAMFPDNPPVFLRRTPHGHYDPDIYRTELAEAGFDEVEVEAIDEVSVASDASIPAIAYCQGTPLRTEIEERNPDGLDQATRTATEAIRNRFGDGSVSSRIRGYVITAS